MRPEEAATSGQWRGSKRVGRGREREMVKKKGREAKEREERKRRRKEEKGGQFTGGCVERSGDINEKRKEEKRVRRVREMGRRKRED